MWAWIWFSKKKMFWFFKDWTTSYLGFGWGNKKARPKIGPVDRGKPLRPSQNLGLLWLKDVSKWHLRNMFIIYIVSLSQFKSIFWHVTTYLVRIILYNKSVLLLFFLSVKQFKCYDEFVMSQTHDLPLVKGRLYR